MSSATTLTLIRVFAIPLVFALWFQADYLAALGLLLFSLLTDLMDGRLARWLDQVTPLGAVLDPVADKANVICFYSYLFSQGKLPVWLVGFTLLRNISQLLSIPVLSWFLKIPFKVKPKDLPKWATATSFGIAYLGMAMLVPGNPFPWLGNENLLAIFHAVLLASTAMEIWILATFLSRLIQIMRRTHDTFE